ncbi:hypothetical protein SLEP1_g39470 [Rubroshorea leprosula]|uniref:Uncharacterized protein n=1 Tax=Rubroshorea leprosula TaxID=152421 RepID=A0AAV5L0B8_9ROSI|nr:hypothetical protein SLEP1_g39470 [Rubroshorea leprosula]
MAKLALREAATYHNSPAVETGAAGGKRPAASCRESSRVYPKIGGTRAIKVNPGQFKAREGRIRAISYQKTEQITPTKQEQPDGEEQSKADPKFCRWGEGFLGSRTRKEGEIQTFSPVSQGWCRRLAWFLLFFFSRVAAGSGRAEARGEEEKKKKEADPYPIIFLF